MSSPRQPITIIADVRVPCCHAMDNRDHDAGTELLPNSRHTNKAQCLETRRHRYHEQSIPTSMHRHTQYSALFLMVTALSQQKRVYLISCSHHNLGGPIGCSCWITELSIS